MNRWAIITTLAAALAGSALAQGALAQGAKDHNAWLGEQLKQLESIKPGMTRAEVEKFMQQDGGLYQSPNLRYIGKECNYCKVIITFRLTGDANRDIVEKVSKPYLEHPAYE